MASRKVIRNAVKKANEEPVVIQNCKFVGTEWDPQAVKVLQTVADGLKNITDLFKAQGLTIDSMITVKNKQNIEIFDVNFDGKGVNLNSAFKVSR